MEKVYTLKELKDMERETIKAARDVLAIKIVKYTHYTARELSAMCEGLLSTQSIAGRASCDFWLAPGKVLKVSGKKRQKMALLDDNGNIIKTFEGNTSVNTYSVR